MFHRCSGSLNFTRYEPCGLPQMYAQQPPGWVLSDQTWRKIPCKQNLLLKMGLEIAPTPNFTCLEFMMFFFARLMWFNGIQRDVNGICLGINDEVWHRHHPTPLWGRPGVNVNHWNYCTSSSTYGGTRIRTKLTISLLGFWWWHNVNGIT